jgi:hypothetical protein
MKKLVMALFIVVSALSVAAQKTNKDKKLKLGIGLDLGAITGILSNNHTAGIGASIQLQYKINKLFSATLQGEFLVTDGGTIVSPRYPGSDYIEAKEVKSQALFPIQVGVKYYVLPKLFVSAQMGAAFFAKQGQHETTKFVYSPSVGYKINNKFDIGLKYSGFIGYFGVEKYYVFGGGYSLPGKRITRGESGFFGIRIGYTL